MAQSGKITPIRGTEPFVCPGCGRQRPYRAKGLCQVCYQTAWSRGRRQTQTNTGRATTLTLDFAGLDDLLDALQGMARDDMRSVEDQVLFILREFVLDYLWLMHEARRMGGGR